MRSDTIRKGFQRTPHRALLRACGLKDEDIMQCGPSKQEIERMREMRDLSDWKRTGEDISRPACEYEKVTT